MTAADALALAPYLVLTSWLMVVLLVIGFARRHLLVMYVTVAGLILTLAATVFTAAAPDGIVMDLLRIDGYAVLFNVLFLVGAIATCLLAYRYLCGRQGELEEFYVLVAVATLGAMTMAAAIHFAAFVLGLEILSIALYAMVAYPEEKHPPLEAALKYLVLSAVASTTMLFGMALIYNATGSMFFADLNATASLDLSVHLYVGQALLFTGIAFKLSLVPFHMWTPDVYQGAPAPVTGFIATVSKAAVFALMLRLAVDADALQSPVVLIVLSAMAVLSMIAGNVLALLQQNLKRLLAYSSIAHMGYLLIGVVALTVVPKTPFIAEAVIVYLAGYVLMTLIAFGVISSLSSAEAGDDAQQIDQLRGLLWRRPASAVCLVVAMLSLMGMPLTAGFIGKFYLIALGVQGALWVLMWALIIGSAISVYYYVKVIYVLTLDQAPEPYPHPARQLTEVPLLVALGIAVVVIGVLSRAADDGGAATDWRLRAITPAAATKESRVSDPANKEQES